ncbi:MAG: hypothetical protein IIC10_06835, partial [Proteobacteria bacterium]|nr:hypothetical protein [Pseudomonadota bacterium]
GGGSCTASSCSSGARRCCSGGLDFDGTVLSTWVTGSSNAKDAACNPSGWSVCTGGYRNCAPRVLTASVSCSAEIKKTCGGQTKDIIKEGKRQCWAKANIYYKDKLIYETEWDNTRQSVSFNDGVKVHSSEAELRISILTDSDYTGGGCNMIVNDYIFKLQPEDFELNIDTVEEIVEGKELQIIITITNKYKPVNGNLIMQYEIPTSIGSAKDTQEQIIDIPLGVSEYKFTIQTDQITDKIFITPQLDVLMAGSEFSGANYLCYGQTIQKDRALSSCDYVLLGTVKEPTQEISVLPSGVACSQVGCPTPSRSFQVTMCWRSPASPTWS